MAWIDKLRDTSERDQRRLEQDLRPWLREGGPSDPGRSPKDLAEEFYEYSGWGGAGHRRRWIELTIGMHQRATANAKAEAEADRGRRAAAEVRDTASVTPASQHINPVATDTHIANASQTKPTEEVTSRVAQLAEYIFHQHPTGGTAAEKKEELRARAKVEGPIPDMTFDEFNRAFQQVYETKKRRPVKGGWPLQASYARRLAEINKRRLAEINKRCKC